LDQEARLRPWPSQGMGGAGVDHPASRTGRRSSLGSRSTDLAGPGCMGSSASWSRCMRAARRAPAAGSTSTFPCSTGRSPCSRSMPAIHFGTGRGPVAARQQATHRSCPTRTFRRLGTGTSNIAVGKRQACWRSLCKAVGAPLAALMDDPRYRHQPGSGSPIARRWRPILDPAGRGAFRSATGSSGAKRRGIPCGPILSVGPRRSPIRRWSRANMVVPLEHPKAGPIRVTGVPVRLSDTPGAVRTPAAAARPAHAPGAH